MQNERKIREEKTRIHTKKTNCQHFVFKLNAKLQIYTKLFWEFCSFLAPCTPYNTTVGFRFIYLRVIFFLVSVAVVGSMNWPPPFASSFSVSTFFCSIDSFFFTFSCIRRESVFLLVWCMRSFFRFHMHRHTLVSSYCFFPFGMVKNLHARYQRCVCGNKILAQSVVEKVRHLNCHCHKF